MGWGAAWRGVLARRAAQERRKDVAAAKIAASWRMYQFRKAFVQHRRYAVHASLPSLAAFHTLCAAP